ncbi:hypothetical protein H0B56_04950 [Haloechinothrix sp. YIM 98757]|uniref:Uncharacterized protein n=1 Tax=Haloechinothrix aidingensis TaxID=2752311 RepID=A0A837ZXJ2_9PSEU|nr:hypothetical protein [Haloechinothrix aidingensis]MBA0124884.1 hypothetical protein [Haloechinothrix aidingensis]
MRKSLVTAGTLAFALAVSGCGGDGGEDSDDKSAEEDPNSAADIALAAGEQAKEQETASFDFKMDIGGQTATGQGTYRHGDDGSAVDVALDAGGQKTELRQVDDAVYMKLPEQMQAAVGTDAPWLDLTESPQVAQMFGGMDQLPRQADPAGVLGQLEEAGTILGTEETEVAGEPATRYKTEVQLGKLKENLPMGITQQALQSLQQSGIESYRVNLDVNEDDLPMQVTMNLTELYKAAAESMGQQGQQQQAPEGKSVITVNYSDWGESVEIEAPPKEEIGEMPEMPQQQPGQQPGQEGQQPQPEGESN